ncbi:MAG: acetate--CoA ligase family protein [candidate division Zixibacteria bacterium]|nr:acetate--CoA ligase family protein [candidate division Zixibacteria bacterium]
MKQHLDAIFRPRSIAVIGASNKRGSIGHATLANIFRAEFRGKVFPVNPTHEVLHSVKAYSTVLDVPDAVDLAVVIVPKQFVPATLRQCGEKGVRGAVVISAGFSEVGGEGKTLERELVDIVREYNMRLVGPNCFGVVNTDPEVSLNCTFGKTFPRVGNVGFITQSGAMGEAIMNQAEQLGIGFSKIASIGNKADISSNDVLEYFKDDPKTDIILLYLENFGNPRNFTSIAREVSQTKPIVAVKSGRTILGAMAASSHTGALGGLDVAVDALFEQTGVMRVDTVEQLFDVAMTLSRQPIPKGNRVVVVTNAGGPGILATDALVNYGMEMPSLTPATVKELKTFSSADASFSNPMDMVAGAGATEFFKTLNVVKKDKSYDSIMAIFVPPVTVDELEVARNIYAALADTDKTVQACFMGAGEQSLGIRYLQDHSIPVYIFPEAAAKALAIIQEHRHWLKLPKGKVKNFKVDADRVREIVAANLDRGNTAIVGADAMQILDAYGIQVAGYHYAYTIKEAVVVARELGYPVVMKVNTPPIVHKTEAGGVLVDLRSESEVKSAFTKLRKRVGTLKAGERFSVVMQEMVTGTVETVIGMTTDPSFGPLIMFGLGGIYVEVMKDVAFRTIPLTAQRARRMIKSLRSYPLLTGFRGTAPVDLSVIEETLLRVSQLVRDFHCLSEIDLNPFIVSASRERCRVVDARLIIKDESRCN